MDINIEALHVAHNRNGFDCGVDELNNFIAAYARQNQKNDISKTFVAVSAHSDVLTETKKEILGFYTLSSGQIHCDCLPERMKHSKYPVAIARLARLAVALPHQRKGVAGFLLYNALNKIKAASEMIGIFAVVVDAKNERTKSFYQRYGFVELQGHGLTLVLPMSVIKKL